MPGPPFFFGGSSKVDSEDGNGDKGVSESEGEGAGNRGERRVSGG